MPMKIQVIELYKPSSHNLDIYSFILIITNHYNMNYISGLVTRPGVELTTKLTTDVYEQYKLDPNVAVANEDDFMDSLDKLLNGGSCGAGCNADVVTCPA